jgi:pimeloyl-ACP methyl ester carboxylesterase
MNIMRASEFKEWTEKEMGSEASPEGGKKLLIKDVLSDNPTGEELPLEFFLFYSFPEPKREDGKNILFIPGGPGTIPRLDQDLENNRLELLEDIGHNVAYFHIRGSGLSRIDPSNKYDRFLRADYVVKDIERLRRRLLPNDVPWDAIWGESHGALIAQRYAHKYGTDKVKKLILVGPPSRSDETHDPRRKMIVSNLEKILSYYHNNKPERSINGNAEDDDSASRTIRATNDFSFLTNKTIKNIKNKLGRMLKRLEARYGSINFVIENYHDLKLKYPLEFFKALKDLAFHGRPVKDLELGPHTMLAQVDVAILIANYLMLPPRTPGGRTAISEETLAPVFVSRLDQGRIDAYKERLKGALKRIADDKSQKSVRAYWVFGVYDGISRWILKFMKRKVDKDGYFRAEDIGPALTHATRYFAEKIGKVAGEPIYPWNPGYYKHSVPTLILKGGADAVIAGGQAESFYKDGLLNKKDSLLMEIPGMGHIWQSSMPVATFDGKTKEGKQVLQELAKEFLRQPSAEDFLEDRQVKEIIKSLGILFPVGPQPKGDKLAKPKIDKLKIRKVLDTTMRLRREGIAAPVEKNMKVRAKAPKTKSSRPRPRTKN